MARRNFSETLNLLCNRDKALLKRTGGINQNELARRTRITQSTIKRMLDGESQSPRPENEEKLCRYFRITGDQLRGRNPIPAIDGEDAVAEQQAAYATGHMTQDEIEMLEKFRTLPDSMQKRFKEALEVFAAEEE